MGVRGLFSAPVLLLSCSLQVSALTLLLAPECLLLLLVLVRGGILEEESLFPKATDKSFEDKLKAHHLGKSAPFAKPNRAEEDITWDDTREKGI